MKKNRLRSFRFRSLLPMACIVSSFTAFGQQAPAPATAAQLAKYDLNKNGRLDPAELAALQTDEAKAAATPTASSLSQAGDEAVQLSPFEVREANNGYYASNTMSG